jgi:hypothetical protein
MGFIRNLASSHFKNDFEGKIIFYPWGVTSTGYILPTFEKKEQLERFLQRTYFSSILFAFLFPPVFGLELSLASLPIFGLWYFSWVKYTTNKMEKSYQKLSKAEACDRGVKIYSLRTLVFIELFLVIGLLCGVWMLYAGVHIIFAIFAVVILGSNAYGVGYMILQKLRA